MGEHPPLLTPQGPVPSELSPFFSRVDDYIAPRSSFVVSRFFEDCSRFCVSSSLPGSHRFVLWNECQSSTRLRALVPAAFPLGFCSPFLRPVLVPLSSPQIHLKLSPSLVLSPFAYALTVWLAGTVPFSLPKQCGCVFPNFPRCFLLLPFVRLSPPRFDRISPDPSARFDCPRIPCGFRFYHPEFGVRFCGPRLVPKHSPHHSPRAAT